MSFCEELNDIFTTNGVLLTQNQLSQFEEFYKMLVETNKMTNLTAIIEKRDVMTKHFLDSVLPAKFIPQKSRVIDIGCGAGFPSIPLKILRPDLHFTLVDSVQKKLNFVQEVCDRLRLSDTRVFHARAEELAHKAEFREGFDICVARAVAELSTLTEYCLPFVKVGGFFLAYKSQIVQDEINMAYVAIKTLGAKLEVVENFKYENINRSVVVFKKVSATPQKFPRDKNKPRLNPLK